MNMLCYAQKKSLDTIVTISFIQYDTNPGKAQENKQPIPKSNKEVVYSCVKIDKTTKNMWRVGNGWGYDYSRFFFEKNINGKTINLKFYTDTFHFSTHKIDYENYKIDNKKVYGFDGIPDEQYAKANVDKALFMSKGVFHLGTKTFEYNFNNDQFYFRGIIGGVYQTVDAKYIIISFGGGESAGSYDGYWIFNEGVLLGEYLSVYGYGNYENGKVDVFANSKKKYYYEIKKGGEIQ